MKSLLLVLPLALAATPAAASSPGAWARFERTVAARCAKASGLVAPRTSAVIGFDDTLGKVATLVSGRYPQPRLRGVPGRMLCVYDQRSGRTWVSEAKGWTAPHAR